MHFCYLWTVRDVIFPVQQLLELFTFSLNLGIGHDTCLASGRFGARLCLDDSSWQIRRAFVKDRRHALSLALADGTRPSLLVVHLDQSSCDPCRGERQDCPFLCVPLRRRSPQPSSCRLLAARAAGCCSHLSRPPPSPPTTFHGTNLSMSTILIYYRSSCDPCSGIMYDLGSNHARSR
jgi:hypothetical protein